MTAGVEVLLRESHAERSKTDDRSVQRREEEIYKRLPITDILKLLFLAYECESCSTPFTAKEAHPKPSPAGKVPRNEADEESPV